MGKNALKKVPHKKNQKKIIFFFLFFFFCSLDIFFSFFAHVSIWHPPPIHLVSKCQRFATPTHPPLC